jgi:phosphatidylglycerol lysyltransferase
MRGFAERSHYGERVSEGTTTSTRPSAMVRTLSLVSRTRGTLVAVGIMLVVGSATGALWHSIENRPAWNWVAYGLPAFEAGRWWTPVVGTFVVAHPALYLVTLLSFVGMAYLEYRRGWRVALLYFGIGQLFAIFGAALILWLVALTPSPWGHIVAAQLSAGPSGGTVACLAAAIGLLGALWRVRAWLVLLALGFVSVLFLGRLDDIQHALAMLIVLSVDRSLRIQHTTVREQRLIAFLSIVSIGVVELIALLVRTHGPFGLTRPAHGSFLDIATDLVLIVFVANGLRHGRRWAWIVTLSFAIFNVFTGILLLLLVILEGWRVAGTTIDGNPSLSLATTVLWMAAAVYLIWVRGAFRASRRRRRMLGAQPIPDATEVKALVREHGGGNLSWIATWEDQTFARVPSGIISYQRRAGVALALGDPLGSARGRASATREFIDLAESSGLVPCFFGAGEATKDAVPPSWRSLVVADDTIVDLPGLAFTGKRWNSVRTSINKAEREGETFRLSHLKSEPWGVQAQMRAISESWVGDRGLPEMSFTLGTLVEAEDPDVRLALAVSPQGDVDGFLSWMPVYAPGGTVRGWTLDLMRRREGGFGPVMEYLIAQSAVAFRDEGAEFMSLSGAPLAHDYPPGAGMIADLSDRLAEALEPVYGFRSLHRFKQKFHPRYEQLYLLYRDEVDLTRVSAALTRAFLPDATLRQFAGAGIDLMLGGERA